VTGQARVLATETVPPWLSRDPRKRTIYRDDLYFWDGWTTFAAAGSGEPDEAVLRHLTFVLMKPEAIVGRRIDAILDFLRARGFHVAGAWPVRLNRHAARALWGYQINSTPIAWVHSLELGVTSGELFVVGLTHALEHGEASTAAELLRLSKGTSSRPGGDTLRDRLNCPARMLSFVHAPDEPADVIRELAIVCAIACDGPDQIGDHQDAHAARLGEVVAALVGAANGPSGRSAAIARSARSIMTSRYSRVAPHDLDVDATLLRMRGYLRDGIQPGLSQETRAAVEQGWTEPERALHVVTSLERAHALPLWDRIVTVAHLTDSFRNDRPMLIMPPV
jgi:nucleoside diphosphate kinase